MTKDTTPPEVYARSVVSEVTKDAPSAWFWTGARVGVVRFGDMFLPRTFWVQYLLNSFIAFAKHGNLTFEKGLALHEGIQFE